MDFRSNVCIAWFCRSTRPFQTFLVSINGQFDWFWSTLLLYFPEILQTTLALPRIGIEHVGISEFRHAYTYLSQVRIKCGFCDDLCFSLLGSLLLISSHMHSIWMPLILDYLPSIGSCLKSDCPAKKVVKTARGNLYILRYQYLSPIIYPHLAHSLPAYGIISRCPVDRMQVASDSAIGTSWFWSASRICPIISSTALWACLKITMDWRGIEPTPGFR